MSSTSGDNILLRDLSQEQVAAVVANLVLPCLIGPFQRLCVDGNMLSDCIDSHQDLVDLDSVEIKPVFAKKLFKALTAWRNDGGRVPRALLSTDTISQTVVKLSSTVSKNHLTHFRSRVNIFFKNN